MLIYFEFILSIFESWHVKGYWHGAPDKNKPLKTGSPSHNPCPAQKPPPVSNLLWPSSSPPGSKVFKPALLGLDQRYYEP